MRDDGGEGDEEWRRKGLHVADRLDGGGVDAPAGDDVEVEGEQGGDGVET